MTTFTLEKMMRIAICILSLSCVLAGCSQPTETVPTVSGGDGSSSGVTEATVEMDSSSEAPPSGDGAANGSGGAVRFVANTRLEVPSMMCPAGCYPAVEETLAQVAGVEAVQLAQQPAGTPEGEIRTKVVELKVGDGFDLEKALAALKEANFEARQVN